VYMTASTLNITGNTTFRKNNAEYYGRSIYVWKTTLNLVTYRVEINSKYADCSSHTFLFMNNSAEILGGAVYTLDSTLTFE